MTRWIALLAVLFCAHSARASSSPFLYGTFADELYAKMTGPAVESADDRRSLKLNSATLECHLDGSICAFVEPKIGVNTKPPYYSSTSVIASFSGADAESLRKNISGLNHQIVTIGDDNNCSETEEYTIRDSSTLNVVTFNNVSGWKSLMCSGG